MTAVTGRPGHGRRAATGFSSIATFTSTSSVRDGAASDVGTSSLVTWQSVNEELTTVNQELKIKIEELGLTNNDFQNLISAADIGAIFLDRSLRVKLSTPRAQEIFNLLPSDVGRRLSDITTRINEPLHEDTLQVLERLQTIERMVQNREGRTYLMRMLAYRTTDDRIEGVALTFHDVTERREAQREFDAGEERLQLLVESAVDYAIFTMSPKGVVDTWNTGRSGCSATRPPRSSGSAPTSWSRPKIGRPGFPSKS